MDCSILIILFLAAVIAYREATRKDSYMNELKNLTDAIAALTVSIDAAVIKLTEPTVPAADVQIAADAVNAQNARLVAALPPTGV